MRPLAGIRILDLTRLLPGPYCTMLLGDLGGEVLKIEPPSVGDYLRLTPPFINDPTTNLPVSARFLALNRNKKSVALSFRKPRGREILMRLARDADVFVESFRPGAVSRWGIGYEAISAIKPEIVYCSLSGYGQSGPDRHRAGHDLNYVARAGLLAINGPADGKLIPPLAPIADLSGGMLAAIAILAALLGTNRTGRGQYLDVSLYEGALSWSAVLLGPESLAGNPMAPAKLPLNGGMPCYNVYETFDHQFITLGALEPAFWKTFCQSVGHTDWINRQADSDLIPQVADFFKTRPLSKWLEFFDRVDACIEPVQSFSDLFNDPQVRSRGVIDTTEAMTQGALPQIGSVFVFSKNGGTPPPRLGQHTRECLNELGIGDIELDNLEKSKIVRTAT